MDWGETKSIMLEVEQLFNRGDDLRDVNDVRKMQGEIELHRINSLKDAKSLIKGFQCILSVLFNIQILYNMLLLLCVQILQIMLLLRSHLLWHHQRYANYSPIINI